MFIVKASPGPETTPGFLSSTRILRRFRPLRLEVMCDALNLGPRRMQALRLVYRYFPDEMPEVITHPEWMIILNHFLHLANDNWFELDWANITMLDYWLRDDYPETEEEMNDPQWESEVEKLLAKLLEFVPFKCLSFQDELNEDSEIGKSPILNVLMDAFKLDGPSDLNLGDTAESRARKAAAWQHLNAGDFSSLPEPLFWLPEVINYVSGQTGNTVLDKNCDFLNWDENWYRWDKDLDLVMNLIRQAKEARARISTFSNWADSDESRLHLIRDLLALPADFATRSLESKRVVTTFTPPRAAALQE